MSKIPFNISRIDTIRGTYRLQGFTHCDDIARSNLEIEHCDIMGTDGWEALNLEAASTQDLLAELQQSVFQHLAQKNRAT